MAKPITYAGRGTQLLYSLDNVTYIPVPQIQQFAPGGSREVMVDQTNLSSPGPFTRPYAVQVDCGDIDFSGVLNPQDTAYLALLAAHLTNTLLFWKALLTDGVTQYTFQAYVSEFKAFDAQVKKAYRWSGKLRLVGGLNQSFAPVGHITSTAAFQPSAFDPAAFQTGSV